jgi:hypothetical protein
MAYKANRAIEQWLAHEVEEELLEPDLPIVDPVRVHTPAVDPYRSYSHSSVIVAVVVRP